LNVHRPGRIFTWAPPSGAVLPCEVTMGKLQLLSDIEIHRRLLALSGWQRHGNTIRRTYAFAGFPEAVAFVQGLVLPAEALNHHPDVDVRYNRVIITLSTHDSGGITENDFALAERIRG
jgi:4a-hydroxytetrahydrobiopterin dehydratase